MNLYVLLAIAFGAISGFSEPPVVPRAFASVVDVRRTRAGRRHVAAVRIAFSRFATPRVARFARIFSFLRIEAPLTGSASPRAPAI